MTMVIVVLVAFILGIIAGALSPFYAGNAYKVSKESNAKLAHALNFIEGQGLSIKYGELLANKASKEEFRQALADANLRK